MNDVSEDEIETDTENPNKENDNDKNAKKREDMELVKGNLKEAKINEIIDRSRDEDNASKNFSPETLTKDCLSESIKEETVVAKNDQPSGKFSGKDPTSSMRKQMQLKRDLAKQFKDIETNEIPISKEDENSHDRNFSLKRSRNEEFPYKTTSKRKNKHDDTSEEEEEEEEEEDQIPNEDNDMEDNTSTYTEMIEQALKYLGGRGTGVEITNFINNNYNSLLNNKTTTWKNSVMGCLSANRKNLFTKEPQKENSKRYVWRLTDLSEVIGEKPEPPISLVVPKEKEKERDESPFNSPNLNDEHHHANYVVLIEQALKNLGGKGTGSEITDNISDQFKELGTNKKKLTYTVNAVLSSKKYSSIFSKEPPNNSGRSIWKLSSGSSKSKGKTK